MITISLDEYGEFEKEDNKPLFVAGLIYDDLGDTVEEKIERKRIEAYYRKAIKSVGNEFMYPNDLHSNGNKKRDTSVVKPVKQKVLETLSEFLEKGTYGGESLADEEDNVFRRRKGKYHLFVLLKSDTGKISLLKSDANKFARDDFAANRYFHMAGSVVNRILFHNPLYSEQMPPIKIDIATRSTGNVASMDRETAWEFREQSYTPKDGNQAGMKYYSIMNADIYRTLISQEMLNSANTDIQIKELRVKSIQYHPGKDKMEFLYLADSICSILGFRLNGAGAEDWLEQILNRVESLNPANENLVFGYDEIDTYFDKAWTCYERKELFEALSIAFDAKRKAGAFAEHYKRVWFPYLEERIRRNLTPDCFSENVDQLARMIMTNNLDQEKLIYMMQQFEAMVPEVMPLYRSEDVKGAVLYKLYDAGVTAFCHIGDPEKAMYYYDKCMLYLHYIGIDDFITTNSKYAVCLEDEFAWDKALEITRKNVKCQELVSQMKKEILGCDQKLISQKEGKTISQMARIMAEQHDPKAEEVFRKALAKLEKGTANYKITQSYLLHFFADMNMQEAFEKEATDYFEGCKTYSQRYRLVSSLTEETHSVFSKEYACYVLIRGLFLFGMNSLDGALWKKLCKLPETWEEQGGIAPNGHPWEITYKYLQLMAIARNDKKAESRFGSCRRECMENRGKMVIALDLFADAEIAEYAEDDVQRDKITKELAEYLTNNFSTMKEQKFSESGEIRYRELEQYFTFMYR